MRTFFISLILVCRIDAFLAQGDTVGCTYSWACNFNPNASVDDGSCLLPPIGCPWPNNPNVGCTYVGADNYSAEAVWDDGSCIYQAAAICPTDVNNNGMTEVQDILLLLGAFGSECATPQSNMLLIGNSFFRPYAENLDVVAVDAGYLNHNSTTVFRGGDNGLASSFWDDSTSQETMNIKAVLDAGGVEFFAMTAGPDTLNPTRGYKEWIHYALQNNPDIEIGISLPMIDFPADWDTTAQALGFNDIHELYPFVIDSLWHTNVIDSLRIEFPEVNIFSIPTGWAGIKLAQMQQDDLLSDDIDLFGAKPTSIFTDAKGHQGQIVIETGTLVWLASIYGDDLSLNTYDTGFATDLHNVAIEIMNDHPEAYKR